MILKQKVLRCVEVRRKIIYNITTGGIHGVVFLFANNMKNKSKIQNVGKVLLSNRKMVERGNINTSNTIYIAWLGICTFIKK